MVQYDLCIIHCDKIRTCVADWTESVIETTLIGRSRDVTMTSDDDVTRCGIVAVLPPSGDVNKSTSSCVTCFISLLVDTLLYKLLYYREFDSCHMLRTGAY